MGCMGRNTIKLCIVFWGLLMVGSRNKGWSMECITLLYNYAGCEIYICNKIESRITGKYSRLVDRRALVKLNKRESSLWIKVFGFYILWIKDNVTQYQSYQILDFYLLVSKETIIVFSSWWIFSIVTALSILLYKVSHCFLGSSTCHSPSKSFIPGPCRPKPSFFSPRYNDFWSEQ